MEKLDLSWWSAYNAMRHLEQKHIIFKTYDSNKRLTASEGVRTRYVSYPKKYRPLGVNSKSWIRLF